MCIRLWIDLELIKEIGKIFETNMIRLTTFSLDSIYEILENGKDRIISTVNSDAKSGLKFYSIIFVVFPIDLQQKIHLKINLWLKVFIFFFVCDFSMVYTSKFLWTQMIRKGTKNTSRPV